MKYLLFFILYCFVFALTGFIISYLEVDGSTLSIPKILILIIIITALPVYVYIKVFLSTFINGDFFNIAKRNLVLLIFLANLSFGLYFYYTSDRNVGIDFIVVFILILLAVQYFITHFIFKYYKKENKY